MPGSDSMEQGVNRETLGRVNEGFEDISTVGDNTINNVTINAAHDLNVDLATRINIPSDTTIHGDIQTDNETNIHLWLCPSKVIEIMKDAVQSFE